MARPFRYRVVDVFTQHPLEGNPLAVFPDAVGLDTETMQRIARELNLAETTFVFPATAPDCVAEVRIFTPTREMMFAGHPTIGTAWLLMDENRAPGGGAFKLQEKVGAVAVRAAEDGMVWLTTPPISHVRFAEAADCARALGLSPDDLISGMKPELLTAGNPTLLVPLRDKAAVDRASLDMGRLELLRPPGTEPVCTFVFTPTPEGAYSRMFAPEHGVVEDPATGSSTGPLGFYMRQHGLAPGPRFHSEQGTKMGRRSFLHVELDGDFVHVGGHVTPLTEALMRLP